MLPAMGASAVNWRRMVSEQNRLDKVHSTSSTMSPLSSSSSSSSSSYGYGTFAIPTLEFESTTIIVDFGGPSRLPVDSVTAGDSAR